MKITCAQFEGLISFYINDELSDNLKQAFEEHLRTCPSCNIRYNMLSAIISDIREAYSQIVVDESEDSYCPQAIEEDSFEEKDDIQNLELSAYIDNELDDEVSVKMRRNIVAKPKLRKKLERLYNLRKVIVGSFSDQKNRLKTDYSKLVLRDITSATSNNQAYFHCIAFIVFVVSIIFISSLVIANII